MTMSLSQRTLALGFTLLIPSICLAEITNFVGADQAPAWQDAVNHDYSTIDFTGYPDNTNIDEQWAYLGAHFVETLDVIAGPLDGFPNDGWGIQGFDEIIIEFDQPITSFAAWFPGNLQFDLFLGSTYLATSDFFGSGEVISFGGIVSDSAFDRIVVYDPIGGTFADDFYFGPPIPAPAALPLLGGVALLSSRRSRV